MSTGVLNNNQKTITLTQAIVVDGIFPTAQSSADMPLGMIRTFAFNYAPASDTLKSQGQVLSISSNQSLFALLAARYGGDGYENFALPDLAGNIEVGSESISNPGQMSGETQATLTQDQLPPLLGGAGQSVDNEQPSIGVNYLIRVTNDPSSGGFAGEVDAFAGAVSSSGVGQFLVAAGQDLLIADYRQLFAVIGTTYGGNGQTTFALPDLRGRSIIGTSSTLSLGAVVGQKAVSLGDANAPVSDGGQGLSFDNRAPGLALNYIICLQGVFPSGGTDGEAAVGEIRAYAGSLSSIPQGWALANGALLSISGHITLFVLLGTTYGGDGTSTFALPDLSDTVIAGSGASQGFGQTYGQNSGSLQFSDAACFCVGSMIRTSRGDIAVEDIQIGDDVVIYDNGAITGAVRRVTWVGQSHAVVRPHLPDDEAGYPVRLLKGAIARSVPCKDMLVTSEHCMFFDGRFVPVRMLVNGRSIFYDKSIKVYEYYHIETEVHSVIMADGVLTESYLDTGNRSAFRQKGKVIAIGHNRHFSWKDAAAPLDVSRIFVEPLFHRLQARIDRVDHALGSCVQAVTNEDGLCLVTETGSIIHSLRRAVDRVMFMIPPGVQSVRIVSNASRPSDVIGPFVDDRRFFGVAVGEILMFESAQTQIITTHFTEPELEGWHPAEGQDMRWTYGNALLPLVGQPPCSLRLLALQIRGAGPYILDVNSTSYVPEAALS